MRGSKNNAFKFAGLELNNFLKVFFACLLLKLVFGALLPMSADEAYYWFWGQHPQMSYFDHPAMVAWLFYLGAKLDAFFSLSHLQISRLPSILLAHLSLYFWYLILKKHLTESQLIQFLLFAILSPLWGMGSIVATPDAPLVFFWSLSIYLFVQILNASSQSKPTCLLYAFLGASLGLGFCSKYHIVLFVPAAIFYLSLEKAWRQLSKKGILILIFTGLVFSSPVLLWNIQNDFASFRFQLQHGLATNDAWKIRWPLEYCLGQFFLLFPTVFLVAMKKPKENDLRLVYYFGWFPILFFLITSLKSKVEANWPIAAYPALICLGYYGLKQSKAFKITFGIWLLAWILVIAQILTPWIPIDERELKTYEMKKYDPLVSIYEKDSQNYFASSYQMAAMISYKTRFTSPLLYKAVGLSRIDYFDFQKESTPNEKRIRIFCERYQPLSKELLDLGYREVSSTEITDFFRLVGASKE